MMELGNQQERPASVAFSAGLIVGEGSFCLGISVHPNPRVKPIFSMHMQDQETMETFARCLEENGLSFRWTDRPGAYAIRIDGFKRVERMLTVFLPHLTGKKLEAANIVNQFIVSRTSKATSEQYTEDEVQLVEQLRAVNGVKKMPRHSLGILRDYMTNSPTRKSGPKLKI